MKIQYFPADLSEILKLGTIKDMHIEVINGCQVLRIECDELVEEEYITVKAKTIKKRTVVKPAKVTKPKTFMDKLFAPGAKNIDDRGGDNWIEKFSKGPNW
jgi:hypothetical protein